MGTSALTRFNFFIMINSIRQVPFLSIVNKMPPLVRFIIFILIILCLNDPSYSQVHIGLKAGQGYTNVGMGPNDPLFVSYNNGSFLYSIEHRADGSRRGFQGSAFAIFDIGKQFSIQTEFLYSVKGSHARNTRHEWVLKYVEFPLLARIEIPFSSSTSLFVLTGVKLGINVFKEFRGIGGIGQPYSYELENVNNLDWGLVFGAGLSHKLGNFAPLLELRYVYGLSKIARIEKTSNFQPEIYYLIENEAKNRQLSILAGIAYKL